MCRYKATAPPTVDYYTCTEIANRHGTMAETSFQRNPSVDPDCNSIEANARYPLLYVRL